MIFATIETATYYHDLVKKQCRDGYLALMFLPPDKREAAIAVYSLDIELEHVAHAVKEEMIGHIRYAWWHENIGKMAIADHPVLKALHLANIKHESLQPMVAAYADVFPMHPMNAKELTQFIIAGIIGENKKWQKATSVIKKHRAKHGQKLESLLLIKLLFV